MDYLLLTAVAMSEHRLCWTRYAYIVTYLSERKVMAKGPFDEVRNVSPDFGRQPKLTWL